MTRIVPTVCLLACAACWGDSSDGTIDVGAPADKFVGSWLLAATETVKCGSDAPVSWPLNGSMSIEKAGPSTINLVTSTPPCTIRFTVSGTTATASAGQSCSKTFVTVGGDEVRAPVTYSGATLDAQSPTAIQITLAGTLTWTPTGDSCTDTVSGMLGQ